jgi:hypothetical protein
MFGSYDGKVYALDTLTGMLRWSYQTGDKVVSSPAMTHDTLYVGSYDHIVYAFGPAVENPPPTRVWPIWLFAVVAVIVILVIIVAVLLIRAIMKPKATTIRSKPNNLQTF